MYLLGAIDLLGANGGKVYIDNEPCISSTKPYILLNERNLFEFDVSTIDIQSKEPQFCQMSPTFYHVPTMADVGTIYI